MIDLDMYEKERDIPDSSPHSLWKLSQVIFEKYGIDRATMDYDEFMDIREEGSREGVKEISKKLILNYVYSGEHEDWNDQDPDERLFINEIYQKYRVFFSYDHGLLLPSFYEVDGIEIGIYHLQARDLIIILSITWKNKGIDRKLEVIINALSVEKSYSESNSFKALIMKGKNGTFAKLPESLITPTSNFEEADYFLISELLQQIDNDDP